MSTAPRPRCSPRRAGRSTARSSSPSCSSGSRTATTPGSAPPADDAAPIAGRIDRVSAQRPHGSAVPDREDPALSDREPPGAPVEHERQAGGLAQAEAELPEREQLEDRADPVDGQLRRLL